MSLADQGHASSKLLRVQQRAEQALNVLATVPMNADRQKAHLKRAMHDILKITKEEMKEDSDDPQ